MPNADQGSFRRRFALCAVLLALMAVPACREERTAAPPAEQARAGASVYRMRGQVLSLPDPAQGLGLTIHHEAVDTFADLDGDVVGMDAMTMPFPTAAGVDLAPLAAGDKVAFTLEVDWEGDPPYRITAIEELPADTPLEFRDARPPGG